MAGGLREPEIGLCGLAEEKADGAADCYSGGLEKNLDDLQALPVAENTGTELEWRPWDRAEEIDREARRQKLRIASLALDGVCKERRDRPAVEDRAAPRAEGALRRMVPLAFTLKEGLCGHGWPTSLLEQCYTPEGSSVNRTRYSPRESRRIGHRSMVPRE